MNSCPKPATIGCIFAHCSKRSSSTSNGQAPKRIKKEVSLDNFTIMRAIGRGTFGKVCLVQKKDTKELFALKYVNKAVCITQGAAENVLQEMEILRKLHHPFLVNLWYSFHDFEDMFMVEDLMLGGDLRYHLHQGVEFDEATVSVYFLELAIALDYLRCNRIIHRDVKPENILLDKHGFAHLSDFNVAVIVSPIQPITSMTGTKEYMAPDIFRAELGETRSYSFEVDWWSLGVTLFELLSKHKPFEIKAEASPSECKAVIQTTIVKYPSSVSKTFNDALKKLLHLDPLRRLHSIDQLKTLPISKSIDFNAVYMKQVRPKFVPPAKSNYDPTYELEELLVEDNPLHKKKKRLQMATLNNGQSSFNRSSDTYLTQAEMDAKLVEIEHRFKTFDRTVEYAVLRLAEAEQPTV